VTWGRPVHRWANDRQLGPHRGARRTGSGYGIEPAGARRESTTGMSDDTGGSPWLARLVTFHNRPYVIPDNLVAFSPGFLSGIPGSDRGLKPPPVCSHRFLRRGPADRLCRGGEF